MCCERMTDWMRGYERSVKLRVEVRGKFGRPPKSLGEFGGEHDDAKLRMGGNENELEFFWCWEEKSKNGRVLGIL